MFKYLISLITVISVFGCTTADYDNFRYMENEQAKLLARKIDQLFPQ